uniref:DUF4817 domain-containing protein n=1 Tax=Tetranychus urticae TaxID=32264 RepID=T1KIN8_TETUR
MYALPNLTPSEAFLNMTLHQRIYFVTAYYKAKKNLQGAIAILRQEYPNIVLPPNRELLLLVSEFEATGTIELNDLKD